MITPKQSHELRRTAERLRHIGALVDGLADEADYMREHYKCDPSTAVDVAMARISSLAWKLFAECEAEERPALNRIIDAAEQYELADIIEEATRQTTMDRRERKRTK